MSEWPGLYVYSVLYCRVDSQVHTPVPLNVRLWAWLDAQYQRLPARTSPVLMTESSGHVGSECPDVCRGLVNLSIGPHSPEREHSNGRLMREFVERHHLSAANTILEPSSGPTFFGPRKHTSGLHSRSPRLRGTSSTGHSPLSRRPLLAVSHLPAPCRPRANVLAHAWDRPFVPRSYSPGHDWIWTASTDSTVVARTTTRISTPPPSTEPLKRGSPRTILWLRHSSKADERMLGTATTFSSTRSRTSTFANATRSSTSRLTKTSLHSSTNTATLSTAMATHSGRHISAPCTRNSTIPSPFHASGSVHTGLRLYTPCSLFGATSPSNTLTTVRPDEPDRLPPKPNVGAASTHCRMHTSATTGTLCGSSPARSAARAEAPKNDSTMLPPWKVLARRNGSRIFHRPAHKAVVKRSSLGHLPPAHATPLPASTHSDAHIPATAQTPHERLLTRSRLGLFFQRAKTRKAVPPTSVPKEIWHTILRMGGALTACWLSIWNGMHASQSMPPSWQDSAAAQIGKNNGKPGCAAVRLINLLDPPSKIFHNILGVRAKPTRAPFAYMVFTDTGAGNRRSLYTTRSPGNYGSCTSITYALTATCPFLLLCPPRVPRRHDRSGS